MKQSALARPVALLEREQEVERVRAALRAAGQRAGAALVIEGAAGMGKSRLLEEACARASDLGLRVLAARATELEQGFPFGVVRQLFERPLLEADAGERDRWLAGAAALAADVCTGAPPAAVAPAPGPAAGDPGYAWQHGLYWLASNLAADSPLALVVDDLQWCDAPSARALAFIARRLEGQPIALILATRPLDPALTPEAAALVADPAAELLRPSALTEAAVSALVAARLSDEPEGRFVRACLDVTGGNPFLVGELLEEAVGSRHRSHRGRRGRCRRDGTPRRRQRGAAPSGAAGAGSRRARPRAQCARRRRAGWATQRDWPDSAAADLEAAMAALVSAGVVESGGTVRLHPPHPARGDLRRPVACRTGATAPRGGGDPARARSARPPGRGAGHAHRAGRRPRGGGTAAGRRPRRAGPGRRSRRGRAALPCPRRASRGGDRAAVVLELGQAHARAGAPEAIAPLSEIVEHGDDAAAIAAAAIELSGMLFFAGRAAEGAATLRRAQERLPAGEPVREQLEIALLGLSYTSASARREAEATIAGLRDPGSPARGVLRATTLAALAMEEVLNLRSASTAIDLAERALAAGLPLEPLRGENWAQLALAALGAADGLDVALRGADEILAQARAAGAALTVVTLSSMRALIAVRRGDLAAAEADAQAAIELSPDLLGVEFLVLAVSAAVLSGLERDETPDALRRLIDRVGVRYDTEFTPSSQLRYASGVLRAAAGNHEAAIEELRGCDDPAFGGENPAMLAWRSAAALSLAELGRHDEARTSGRGRGAPRAVVRRAARDRRRAARRRARRPPRGTARSGWRRRSRCWNPRRRGLEHARVLVDLGATFRAAGQRSAAREPLLEGLALAARCGARAPGAPGAG